MGNRNYKVYLILDFKEWPIMGRNGICIYETKSMKVGIQLIVMIILTDAVNKHKKIKKNR